MKKLTLFLTVTLFIAFQMDVMAVDKFWRPDLTLNFHDAGNWFPLGVPGPGDYVHFDQFDILDCHIYLDASVQGIIVDVGYSGVVWIEPDVDVTMGNAGFTQHDGTFQCANGDVWCQGDFYQYGGAFSTPLGTLGFGKDIYLQPAFPGFFFDNGGWIELFYSSSGTLMQIQNFFNVRISKTSGATVTIPSGMWLSASQQLELNSGYVNGPGELRSNGTTWVNSGMQSGSAPLVLGGATGAVCHMESTNWSQQKIVVRMQDFASSVSMQSSLGNLELLANGDTLQVELGIMQLDHPSCLIQCSHTIIDPPGTLIASSGTTSLEQNWENNGTFQHNNGNFRFVTSYGSAFETDTEEVFYNLSMNKASGAITTVGMSDQVRVMNKYESISGYLNGPDAILLVEDTAHFASSHVKGNIPVEFTGSAEGNFIYDGNQFLHNSITINKATPSTTVFIETNNSFLEMGDYTNETVQIEQGILAFQNCGTYVNWDVSNLVIEPNGTFTAWDGTTYFSGHFTNQGGTFLHNTGIWVFDETYARTFDGNSITDFYNVQMNKGSGTILTVQGTDTIHAQNKYTSSAGYLNGPDARLAIADTAWFQSSHVKGSIPVSFTGTAEGNFIYDGTQFLFNEMLIDKNDPATRVYFETNNGFLELGDYTNETVTVNRGTLAFQNCGTHVNWDVSNLIIQPEGTFEAWGGTTYHSGHFNNQGGKFLHNNGNWVFDETYSRTFDGNSITHFYNLQMNKGSGSILTVQGTDTIHAQNKYTSSAGYLHGVDARLAIADTAWYQSSHVKGSIPVSFTGSAEGNFFYDGNSFISNEMLIDKDDPATRVYFETNTSFLELGDYTNETVTVVRGTLAFQNCGSHVNWDVSDLVIQPEGTFEAWGGTTYHSGHFTNQGGTFLHNMGNWVFDETYGRTFDGNSITDFYNLQMNKGSGTAMTVQGTDTIRAQNKYTSSAGYLHGVDARLAIADTAWFQSSHVKGSIPVSFTGSAEGNFIYDGNQVIFNEMLIDKDDPATRVYFETNNGFLELGDYSNETVTVNRGTLAFQNCGTHVNWDVSNLLIQPEGTFEAWGGITYHSGHFTNQGGTFLHNMGNWVFDETYGRTFDGNSITDFYNLQMNKGSGTAMTVQGTDTIRATNKYTSSAGYLHGVNARLAIADTAWYQSSHVKGSIPVSFTGSTEGNFIYDGNSVISNEMIIDKDAPTTRVYFETNTSNLELGDYSNETVTIENGTLAFQNYGTHVNWDVSNLIINPNGTLIAPEMSLFFSGHFDNQGGTFEHNNGVWQFDENYARNFNGNDRTSFFNLEFNKSFSSALTVVETDTVEVVNKYTSFTGYLNGNGVLSALDTAHVTSTHLTGSLDLEFIGGETANFIIDRTNGSCFGDVFVRKSPGTVVYLETGNSSLSAGTNGQNFTLSSGEAHFQNCGTHVDWNFENTYLDDGTFVAWNGTTNWTRNLTTVNGMLDGNGGHVFLTGSYSTTFDLGLAPDFFDLTAANTFSSNTTLSSGPMNVHGTLNFDAGYMNGGEIHAFSTVLVEASYPGGSSVLQFSGTDNQIFDLTGGEDNYEGVIRLNKPEGDVTLASDLIIEDNIAQLDFTMGNLVTSPTSRVIFNSGVTTGWMNASNDSYIDGEAVKIGTGALELPLGNAGWYGPMSFSAFPIFNDVFSASYVHASPEANGYPQNMDVWLDHVSACEYWEVTREVGTYNPFVTLSYDEIRCGAIDNPTDLRVAEWTGSMWEDRGASNDTGTSITASTQLNTIGIVTLGSVTSDNPMDTTGGAVGCPEDFNSDGLVNTADLLTLLSEFGCTGGCSTDLDGDGAVSTSDLLAFLSAYGSIC